MSDYGFSDPRSSDPRDYRRPELSRGSGDVNSVWGWIAAAVFVAAVLVFVFAAGNSNNTAAHNGVSMPPTASAPPLPQHAPSETTGAAPSAPMQPAPAPRSGQ
ncbi:MAG TPA: hypothetical protein VII40_03740 [Xanthobacteraceae bacterium]|jgi:hypothetical protein